jgi:cytochrome c biogenesis protein ResB
VCVCVFSLLGCSLTENNRITFHRAWKEERARRATRSNAEVRLTALLHLHPTHEPVLSTLLKFNKKWLSNKNHKRRGQEVDRGQARTLKSRAHCGKI